MLHSKFTYRERNAEAFLLRKSDEKEKKKYFRPKNCLRQKS